MISARTYLKMTRFHASFGGNSNVYFQNTSFLKWIFKRIRGFLEKMRDNLTSTSVKVVPEIILYPKSPGLAQTVEFSRRTSSQSAIKNSPSPPPPKVTFWVRATFCCRDVLQSWNRSIVTVCICISLSPSHCTGWPKKVPLFLLYLNK